MTELFERFPQPWSPRARDDRRDGASALQGLIASKAQQQLADELRRYVLGEIAGRAFLIAGHRGAGKTTAVLAAMQRVYNECVHAEIVPRSVFRPLLIRLHGPSLLLAGREERKENAPPSSPHKMSPASSPLPPPPTQGEPSPPTTAKLRAEGPREKEDKSTFHSRRMLEEMAAGLFPALLDELRREMARHAGALSGGPEYDSGHAELAAHVCDELLQGMSLAELREAFRRLGLLNAGLLGRGRAFEELTAIAAARDVYQIVTGKLQSGNDDTSSHDQMHESKHSIGLNVEKLLTALSPVAAGVAGAVGLAYQQPLPAMVVALAILASGMASERSSRRARSRKANRSRSFARDDSPASLVRRIPLLVEQLRDLGFAPIFVVDELDKVDNAVELLCWLMSHLKSYVTERTFMCFVVERSYYKRLTSSERNERYTAEHTFYSDSSYVVFEVGAFHAHLRALSREDATLTTAPDAYTRQLTLAMLRHVLLHRARMHPYDLRRELRRSEERGELTAIRDPQVEFRPPLRWTYRAFVQLAIEWVMSETTLRELAAEKPYFAQELQDVLYQVSDCWQEQANVPLEDPDCHDPQLRDLLLRARQTLLGYLCDPESLANEVRQEGDGSRLQAFFAGEQEAQAGEDKPVIAELEGDQLPLPREDLIPLYARRKYRVLRLVTSPATTSALSANRGLTWLIGPLGYSPGLQNLDASRRETLEGLVQLHERFAQESQLAQSYFASLWNTAEPTSTYSFEGFTYAWSKNLISPGDSEQVALLYQYALKAPTLVQLVRVLVLGLALVRKIAPNTATETAIARMGEAMQGLSVEQRTRSAAGLVRELAIEYEIALPPALDGWLANTLKGGETQAIAEVSFRDVANPTLGESSSLQARNDVRQHWYESFAERYALSLKGSSLVASAIERGARLDFVAQLEEWIPPALVKLWTVWPAPNEWTLEAYSELLADAHNARQIVTPWWLIAHAAAQLGQATPLDVAVGHEHSPHPAVHEVLDAAIAKRRVMAQDRARILLLDAGPVMSRWRVEPDLAGQFVVSCARDASPEQRAKFDIVFCESEAPRAGHGNFFRVLTAPTGGRDGAPPRGDTEILREQPASLSHALRLVRDLARRP